MYCPLGQYLGNMVKLGPLVKSDFYASISSEKDRFMTHMAMMLSRWDMPRKVDVVPIVIVVVVVVVYGVMFVTFWDFSSH